MRRVTMTHGLFITAIAVALVAGVPRVARAQDARSRVSRCTPRRSARCATPSPARAARASPLDGVGAKLSAADIRQWIVEPVAMAKKASSTKKPPMPKQVGQAAGG